MKKILCFVLLIALSFSVFANGQNEGTDENEIITIKYGFWGNADAIGVEQDIIDEFEALHPNIKIEPVVAGWQDYHTKLLTMMVGDLAPDVMRVDSYFFQDFVGMNAFYPLNDLVARDNVDTTAYYQQGINENTYEGTLYGLPWATAAFYILLNLDMFEEKGIPVPSMDWTVDEFYAILEKFNEDPDTYGFATRLNSFSDVLPFVWAEGGDLFNKDRTEFTFDRPEAVAALQRLANAYQNGAMPHDSLVADGDAIVRWFVNNKLAMFQGAAAEILSVQKIDGCRFEVWPAPGNVVKDTTLFKSNIIGINKSSKHVEAAWEFLKFLRGPEGQGETLYMEAKRMPPTINDEKYWSLYADPTKYPKMIKENSELIASKYGHNLPLRKGWLEIQQIGVPALQEVFLGQKTAKEAMGAISDKVQDVIANNN